MSLFFQSSNTFIEVKFYRAAKRLMTDFLQLNIKDKKKVSWVGGTLSHLSLHSYYCSSNLVSSVLSGNVSILQYNQLLHEDLPFIVCDICTCYYNVLPDRATWEWYPRLKFLFQYWAHIFWNSCYPNIILFRLSEQLLGAL